ncbi:MAG: DUF1599 domain-containing protein [Chitinophagales bacterium]
MNIFPSTRKEDLAGLHQSTIETMNLTQSAYDQAVESCKEIFLKKTRDYGSSWRVLRTISIADQLYIKAQRIRNVQELGKQKVGDDISSEFRGIVNYGVIGLIQLEMAADSLAEITLEDAEKYFDLKINLVKKVMMDKNHDYGEAWRNMSQEGFVDLILMKLMRIRQILSNEGKTLISEGVDSNLVDIINYSLFALILIDEGKHGNS